MIRVFAVAALSLLAAGCGSGPAVQTRTPPWDIDATYAVHGDHLYLHCTGRGSPVVVLEAGGGGDHRVWDAVQPELARTTRVCSYDRAGLALSDAAPKRATATQKANDLHDLLSVADVRGPYVLVGHSYGGMLVRVYADRYPDDIAGVVLLDSSHPDQIERLLAALPPRRVGENAMVRDLRRFLTDESQPNPEGADWTASSDEARAAGSLRNRPLIVVTAGKDEWPLQMPAQLAHRLRHAWLKMQADLAQLSTNHVHVIAVYSPHLVMTNLGQPDLVIRAIRVVTNEARSHVPLPRCSTLFAAPAAKCFTSTR